MATSALQASSGFKYLYLLAFFALLSGFFHPFLAGSSIIIVIIGVAVLFAGLTGGILLYKATTYERRPGTFVQKDDLIYYAPAPSGRRRWVFLAGGFVLVAISLVYIYQLTGRV